MGNRDIWDEIELVSKAEHLDEEMFEYLSAYADGECTAKERRLLEAYLAESAEARAQLAELRMQASMAADGFVDPPEWLRGAILAKTVDRPRLKWPFAAALTAATAGAAALAIYWTAPESIVQPRMDLLANVVEQPEFIPRVVDETEDAPGAQTAPPVLEANEETTATKRSIQQPPGAKFTVAARGLERTQDAEKPIDVQPVKPAAAEQEPDPQVTYAVAEYGGGRFEAKQPDVFDAEPPSAEPSRTGATASPTVLPDAREKLRDKVRKMNEEKLEIEGAEK